MCLKGLRISQGGDCCESVVFSRVGATTNSRDFPNTTTTTTTTTKTTTKPFVPGIWGKLHEPKENYTGSGTWISFLHSFLSSNMPSLRPLASISCRITSIHVFFSLPCALLTFPNLIRSTRQTGAFVGLRHT